MTKTEHLRLTGYGLFGKGLIPLIGRTKAELAAARARGRSGGRPRKMDKHMLKMAITAMSDRNSVAADVAKRLGITTTTLYMYVNGDGSPKASGTRLLESA